MGYTYLHETSRKRKWLKIIKAALSIKLANFEMYYINLVLLLVLKILKKGK